MGRFFEGASSDGKLWGDSSFKEELSEDCKHFPLGLVEPGSDSPRCHCQSLSTWCFGLSTFTPVLTTVDAVLSYRILLLQGKNLSENSLASHNP